MLGIDARIWLGIETDYRLHKTRAAEAKAAAATSSWARSFPIDELVKRCAIDKPATDGEAVSALLSFFGVASVDAWHVKFGAANIAYRHSPSFESDRFALTAWLRLAEIETAEQTCAEYGESAFKKALAQVRRLTRANFKEALSGTLRLCNDAGVALALVKPLSKTRLSGAAWWLSPRRPIIALSARHKTDDHLWFSLFHEAAHVVLHSKKRVFVDGINGGEDEIETEANEWAANFLVSRSAWRRFVGAGVFHAANIWRIGPCRTTKTLASSNDAQHAAHADVDAHLDNLCWARRQRRRFGQARRNVEVRDGYGRQFGGG